MGETLSVQRRGSVMEVTVDRPKANAIDSATSREMGVLFAEFRDDPDLRVAIVTGAGERFFCAGWDLKDIAEGGGADYDLGVGGWAGLQELPGLTKPVIAAVNGMALGGGFEMALCADFILCAQGARFSLPELRAGILADGATIKLRRRIPYHVAVDLLMTGRWMEAEEARAWGLVRSIYPAGELMGAARELADLLASGPPLLYPAIKDVLRLTEELDVRASFDLLNGGHVPSVKRLYESEDFIEGARAFAEKRDPIWRGR
ncbi:MAG TPA: enoyl-CoA hydratase-related protein [Candidatus Saccharimonadales bacterium]|nr:enoyl-CoA hydratase-related protein [Candidatus Saccharimonadales bacterium]